jgi:glycosyltransferase involved in cell wall biosynthesis
VAKEVSQAQLSVIIPTRNRADLLDNAIASVLGSPLIVSKNQILVVDDGSHDLTEYVVQKHGVPRIRVENRNVARNRNAGLALVTTPYVTFLDDDDVWLPGNMEPQLKALERHPGAAFSYGIAQCATENLQPISLTFPSPPLPSGIVPEQLHMGYPNLGVVLFRRDAVASVGGFDPSIVYGQDADLLLRIAAEREIIGVDFVGMMHRLRSPSKARANYYWERRGITRWAPRHLGVGWRPLMRFRIRTRGLFFSRFCSDALACVLLGLRRDAFECLSRAVRVSPLHAIRHFVDVGLLLSGIVMPSRRQPERAIRRDFFS